MTDSSLHATLRELRAIRLAVQALAATRANQLQHTTVQWFSDSQPGVLLLRAMKGAPDCLQEVRLIYQMAMQLDMDFSWDWRPREDPVLFRADEYSKDDDFGDVNVQPAASRRLQRLQMRHPASGEIRRWGKPTLDVFAGPTEQEHVVGTYYTRHHCPGTAGVDAMYQAWSMPGRGAQLAWVFPPANLVAAVLDRLLAQPIHAVLVLSSGRHHPWASLLHALERHVVAEARLWPEDTAHGGRAPVSMRREWKASMRAYRLWPQAALKS